jgi:glycyl-tRNA synthetase
VKPPFGIAQVGKSFRNEITPGQLRVPHPRVRADGDGVLRAARGGPSGTSTGAERDRWYLDLGMPAESLRLRPHDADELSPLLVGHQRRRVPVPVGLGRAGGHRQPRRLRPHPARRRALRRALDWFDQAANERYVPHVIEPAAGATRTAIAFLLAAYDEEEVRGETRTCCACTRASRPTRWRCCRCRRSPSFRRPLGSLARRAARRVMCDYDETRRSVAATAARTSWARRTASPSTSTPRGRGGHRPRPRLDGAGSWVDRCHPACPRRRCGSWPSGSR